MPSPPDEVPVIESTESFIDVVTKLTSYICKAVDAAYTYEQLRTSFAGHSLRPLILSLSDECHHPAIVAALLASRYALLAIESDGSSVNKSRALACEFVAWQFLTFLSEKELMDYLLYDLPKPDRDESTSTTPTRAADGQQPRTPTSVVDDESAPLLRPRPSEYEGLGGPNHVGFNGSDLTEAGHSDGQLNDMDGLADTLAGMNALEIALVCDAKKFISSQPVQKVVTDVWNGDIVFWENMSVHAVKKPTVYRKRAADPFIRLRVPKYQKAFQVIFFLLVRLKRLCGAVGPQFPHALTDGFSSSSCTMSSLSIEILSTSMLQKCYFMFGFWLSRTMSLARYKTPV